MPAIDMIPKDDLVDMLRKCREQFAYYGQQHRAKVPGLQKLAGAQQQIEDTERKAAVNEQLAKQIDDLIGPPPGAKA